jgi:hypothetical protein
VSLDLGDICELVELQIQSQCAHRTSNRRGLHLAIPPANRTILHGKRLPNDLRGVEGHCQGV